MHPQRMRQLLKHHIKDSRVFQSTHPQRMRRRRAVVRTKPDRSFNPRIRKGCDFMFMKSFIDNTFNLYFCE